MTRHIDLTDELLREALRVDGAPTPPDLAGIVRTAVSREPVRARRRLSLGPWLLPVPAAAVWLLVLALLLVALMSVAVGRPRPDPIAVVPSPTQTSQAATFPPPSPSDGVAVAGVLGRTIELAEGDWMNPNGGLEVAGATWLSNAQTNEVVRVDIGSGAIVRIPLAASAAPSADIPLAWDGTTLWAGLGTREIVAIDPTTNTVGARIAVDIQPYRIAAAGGRAWVTDYGAGVVLAVDLAAGTVDVRRADVPGAAGIAFDGEQLFMAQREGPLMLLDPETLETVRERPVLLRVMSIFPVDDRIYVHRNDGGPVSYVPRSLDPAAREVTGLPHSTLAILDGEPWIGPWHGTPVQRLDPATMRPVAAIDPGIPFPGMVAAGGSVWAIGTIEDRNVMQEIQPAP